MFGAQSCTVVAYLAEISYCMCGSCGKIKAFEAIRKRYGTGVKTHSD